MESTELLYDISVNDMFGQYVFWVGDFDIITKIAELEESAVSFSIDRDLGVITLQMGHNAFRLNVTDDTLLDKLTFDGVMLIISVPSSDDGHLSSYTLTMSD